MGVFRYARGSSALRIGAAGPVSLRLLSSAGIRRILLAAISVDIDQSLDPSLERNGETGSYKRTALGPGNSLGPACTTGRQIGVDALSPTEFESSLQAYGVATRGCPVADFGK